MRYILLPARELGSFVVEVSMYVVVNFLVGIDPSANLGGSVALSESGTPTDKSPFYLTLEDLGGQKKTGVRLIWPQYKTHCKVLADFSRFWW